MATSPQSPATASDAEQGLHGQRVVFVGKLAGMTRPEARQAVISQGGEVLGLGDETTSATLVILGDDYADLASALDADSAIHQRLSQEVAEGRATLLRESELWHRLGMVEDDHDVRRLYTPAMLADLLEVPVAAVRRWHRFGTLQACRSVRRLPYFDFVEVAVARHLAALLKAGCSLRVIERKLGELSRSLPEEPRPLCNSAVVVSGRQLFLRRGDDLSEPHGQLLIDFDKPSNTDEECGVQEQLLSISSAGMPIRESADLVTESLSMLDQLQQEAVEWEDEGELERAAETYRTILVAGGPTAEIHFALADVLYRMGDLPAARERYYAAVEQDEEYVEARANLGSVLAENNELELAVAAFQGALAYHPDYADVHYHLANSLERLSRHEEAKRHWHTFLMLAPESPWAENAREHWDAGAAGPKIASAPTS
jgi:tetratricopeptide (TPR) repeat protein